MKIACIGWGSLIWNPGSLLIHRQWFMDGPFLPIEYVRKSNDGRLTLVITENAEPVRTLWALMATDDLDAAKKSLYRREGITKECTEKNMKEYIGSVSKTANPDELIGNSQKIIFHWLTHLDLDAAIWTNLTPKFKDGIIPTIDQAITYLKDLDINAFTNAEEYVRKTPKQIDTDFRRRFEAEFGWTSIG